MTDTIVYERDLAKDLEVDLTDIELTLNAFLRDEEQSLYHPNDIERVLNGIETLRASLKDIDTEEKEEND